MAETKFTRMAVHKVGRSYVIATPAFAEKFGEAYSERYALLFAAAPELYAALKSVEWLTKIIDNELVLACPRCTSIDGEHFPGCEIDEVLRKARGEA